MLEVEEFDTISRAVSVKCACINKANFYAMDFT